METASKSPSRVSQRIVTDGEKELVDRLSELEAEVLEIIGKFKPCKETRAAAKRISSAMDAARKSFS